jgi:hypothetical protein
MRSCNGNHSNGSPCLVDDPCESCQRAMGVHADQREHKRVLSLEDEVTWLRSEVKRLGGRLTPPKPKRRLPVFSFLVDTATKRKGIK